MSVLTQPDDPAQPTWSRRAPTARIVEVFSSIQGEAELVGVRQIFLRLFGCNLRCLWCDSPETLTAPKGPLLPGRAELTPGGADFAPLPNPATLEAVLDAVARLARVPHHSVSITGGEPLLHVRFLERLLPELQRRGLPTYLETNGLLPGHLERVVDAVDWISMDLKPPSCTGDPLPDWLERHAAFLQVAQGGRKPPRLFLKLIVSADALEAELRAAFRLAAEAAPGAGLTLQPVTPFGRVVQAPTMAEMLRWHEIASEYVGEVRVIPQLHKLMNVL
ncbi:MAG: Organic radical activating enzyme [Armatimonadetes bacterium]|jgi:organic radical activating enzyme|nr:Organic radical activating enzyme [Armatimonadota bacterium]